MDIARKLSVKTIVKKLIKSEDYRIVTQTEINTRFLDYCIEFFKKVIDAKINDTDINLDWYKTHFVTNDKIDIKDLPIYAGINKKTITNMHNSGRKEIVIEASIENYDALVESIEGLLDEHSDIGLNLSLTYKDISVNLNLNESLIVINSLAVKRAAIRGGAYSATGKNVEGPLMLTLCKLYSVPEENYSLDIVGGGKASTGDFEREIDFFLKSGEIIHKCEVKLMGKGNPESADVFIARESKVFIADKLSEKNKTQFDSLDAQWLELRSPNGYRKFEEILTVLEIPCTAFDYENLDEMIDEALDDIFRG